MRLSEKSLPTKRSQRKYGLVIVSEANNLDFRSQIVIHNRDTSLRSAGQADKPYKIW
jgi:hypothetical protein